MPKQRSKSEFCTLKHAPPFNCLVFFSIFMTLYLGNNERNVNLEAIFEINMPLSPLDPILGLISLELTSLDLFKHGRLCCLTFRGAKKRQTLGVQSRLYLSNQQELTPKIFRFFLPNTNEHTVKKSCKSKTVMWEPFVELTWNDPILKR